MSLQTIVQSLLFLCNKLQEHCVQKYLSISTKGEKKTFKKLIRSVECVR